VEKTVAVKVVTVALGERSYEIEVGPGILGSTEAFKAHVGKGGVLVVTNATVAPLYLDALMERLSGFGKCETLVLPDGESYKNLDTLNTIFDALLEKKYARDATLVALGGGVIGDMVGFAAACYQRGIDFIQVPTTLLSQVDSSVGGKTGVNHPLGKNMIGAFYQPKSVVIDTRVLSSLPNRELSAGLAEVIKYGFIYDLAFLTWLEANMEGLLRRDEDLLVQAIVRSCEIKAAVVAEDERENDRRAILNFGHTYGHAIEVSQGYGVWLHGEAVGAGMVMASALSSKMGWISPEDHERVVALVKRAGLPSAPPVGMGAAEFTRFMALDKKVSAGKLKLVLLKSLGHAVVTADFDTQLLHEQLAALN
jgi:3-dehydroquinate synthase